jgi:hypothetical protein
VRIESLQAAIDHVLDQLAVLGFVQRLDVFVIHLVQHINEQADVFVFAFALLRRGAERHGECDQVGAEDSQQPHKVPARHE